MIDEQGLDDCGWDAFAAEKQGSPFLKAKIGRCSGPTWFCCVARVLRHWEKVCILLGGTPDRAERQRLEAKAENKSLTPILCSLRMSDASLHGNDVRQTNYDSYVLLPETLIDKNIFANSFAVRLQCSKLLNSTTN